MQNTNTAFRGDILRVSSVSDSQYAKHVGHNYWLVRVFAGQDVDVAGNKVGPMRYAFNLVNTNDGKARITKQDRLFVTTSDGINQGIPLWLLEQHFHMRFKLITTEGVIAPKVNAAVQVEKDKADNQQSLMSLAKTIAAILGTGILAQQTFADSDPRYGVGC